MIYEQVRSDITNGDLLFFRGKLLHSRIIQRWSRSVYSHVGIAHWIKSDGVSRLAVVEAMEGKGIRLFPLRRYLEQGDDVDWYQVTDKSINRDKVVAWAMDRWGKQYARPRQFIRSFVTVPLLNSLGIATKLDNDRWFCSQFSTEALMNGGWTPAADDMIKPELAAPGDVAMFSCLHRQGPLLLAEDYQKRFANEAA